MKKILVLIFCMLSPVAMAEIIECDAMSSLNRPVLNGPQSIPPITFGFSKYGAFQQSGNNSPEIQFGEAEFDGVNYYHTSEDGRINLRQEVSPIDNQPIVVAYEIGTDKATVYSHCKITEAEQ